MKAFISLCIILTNLVSYSQTTRHIIGLSGGQTMHWKNGLYVNTSSIKAWPDNKPNPVLNISYEYLAGTFFKFGAHFEYEKSDVEMDHVEFQGNDIPDLFDEDIVVKRKALGISWTGHYPDYLVRLELGGYANAAFASSSDWDNKLKGIEYGIVIGPAICYEPFIVSVHFKPGFSYLFSDGDPEDVLLYYPRLLFKLSYFLPTLSK